MRLIDADDFGNRMYHEAFEKDSDLQKWDSGCWIRYKLFENVLREQPTVQPDHTADISKKADWIPCSERMPSETVIVTVETKTFKRRYVCEAVWIPRWTWKASFDEWEDCSEYKEDDDEYYVLEGWYERVHNWDEYAYVGIDDNVIAWMPLPELYRGGDE